MLDIMYDLPSHRRDPGMHHKRGCAQQSAQPLLLYRGQDKESALGAPGSIFPGGKEQTNLTHEYRSCFFAAGSVRRGSGFRGILKGQENIGNMFKLTRNKDGSQNNLFIYATFCR